MNRQFYIKGKSVSKAKFIKKLLRHGGEVFTLAACEPDKISKRIWTDGKQVFKE